MIMPQVRHVEAVIVPIGDAGKNCLADFDGGGTVGILDWNVGFRGGGVTLVLGEPGGGAGRKSNGRGRLSDKDSWKTTLFSGLF